jgi:hypothetical protein
MSKKVERDNCCVTMTVIISTGKTFLSFVSKHREPVLPWSPVDFRVTELLPVSMPMRMMMTMTMRGCTHFPYIHSFTRSSPSTNVYISLSTSLSFHSTMGAVFCVLFCVLCVVFCGCAQAIQETFVSCPKHLNTNRSTGAEEVLERTILTCIYH